MRIELSMCVRGDDRTVRWEDGVLSGDDEVLRRLDPLIERGQVDITDLLSVVRGAELVTAQQVTLAPLDLLEPDVDLRGAATPPPLASSVRRS
jgi:hypothetical protein